MYISTFVQTLLTQKNGPSSASDRGFKSRTKDLDIGDEEDHDEAGLEVFDQHYEDELFQSRPWQPARDEIAPLREQRLLLLPLNGGDDDDYTNLMAARTRLPACNYTPVCWKGKTGLASIFVLVLVVVFFILFEAHIVNPRLSTTTSTTSAYFQGFLAASALLLALSIFVVPAVRTADLREFADNRMEILEIFLNAFLDLVRDAAGGEQREDATREDALGLHVDDTTSVQLRASSLGVMNNQAVDWNRKPHLPQIDEDSTMAVQMQEQHQEGTDVPRGGGRDHLHQLHDRLHRHPLVHPRSRLVVSSEYGVCCRVTISSLNATRERVVLRIENSELHLVFPLTHRSMVLTQLHDGRMKISTRTTTSTGIVDDASLIAATHGVVGGLHMSGPSINVGGVETGKGNDVTTTWSQSASTAASTRDVLQLHHLQQATSVTSRNSEQLLARRGNSNSGTSTSTSAQQASAQETLLKLLMQVKEHRADFALEKIRKLLLGQDDEVRGRAGNGMAPDANTRSCCESLEMRLTGSGLCRLTTRRATEHEDGGPAVKTRKSCRKSRFNEASFLFDTEQDYVAVLQRCKSFMIFT
ncbi:unnamed protein product [Amoebophrya sp. A120]|nr:unnamed protein product [Amoebophrya sp. A120]|eukprot:GSA120T00014565001.1